MPSQALIKWMTTRLVSLKEYEERQFAVGPLSVALRDECLRSLAMLLSAHFQGFCRDLYTELTQKIAAAIPPSISLIMQTQCSSDLKLNNANPSFKTIASDFWRFGIDIKIALEPNVPAQKLNKKRRSDIHQLNEWRNYCAHYNDSVPTEAGEFTLARVTAWKQSCDEFAVELDRVVMAHLQSLNLTLHPAT